MKEAWKPLDLKCQNKTPPHRTVFWPSAGCDPGVAPVFVYTREFLSKLKPNDPFNRGFALFHDYIKIYLKKIPRSKHVCVFLLKSWQGRVTQVQENQHTIYIYICIECKVVAWVEWAGGTRNWNFHRGSHEKCSTKPQPETNKDMSIFVQMVSGVSLCCPG